jgi:hypothetical protein
MSKQPSPPVPQKLREMLKDYPEYIAGLQQSLNRLIEKPLHGTPPFELATWLLEDTLGDFAIDARAELSAAEASGDPEAIAHAKAKAHLMGRARSGGAGGGMCDLDDLWDYFQVNKEAFQ